jgi:hypothetical protein
LLPEPGTRPWAGDGGGDRDQQAGCATRSGAFRDRDFQAGFRIRVDGVATPHDSVELTPLAGQLDALPDAATWSVRMRRSLVPLSERDATLLLHLLEPKLRRRTDVLAAYLDACKVTAT